MIGERNLAPEKGPNVWTRPGREAERPRKRWIEGLGGAAIAAAGAALVAAGGSRVYRALRTPTAPDSPEGLRERNDQDGDAVAVESAASFPASDSPSWTPVHGVSPRDMAGRIS